MAAIKPAEVSAILKNQLAGTDTSSSLDEVGNCIGSRRRNRPCVWII